MSTRRARVKTSCCCRPTSSRSCTSCVACSPAWIRTKPSTCSCRSCARPRPTTSSWSRSPRRRRERWTRTTPEQFANRKRPPYPSVRRPFSSAGPLQRDPHPAQVEAPLVVTGVPHRLNVVTPVVDRRRWRAPRCGKWSVPRDRRRRAPAPRRRSVAPWRVVPSAVPVVDGRVPVPARAVVPWPRRAGHPRVGARGAGAEPDGRQCQSAGEGGPGSNPFEFHRSLLSCDSPATTTSDVMRQPRWASPANCRKGRTAALPVARRPSLSASSLQRNPDSEEPEAPLVEALVPCRLLVVAPVVDGSWRRPVRRRQRPEPVGRWRRTPAPRRGSVAPRGVTPASEGFRRRWSAVPVTGSAWVPVTGSARVPVAGPAARVPVAWRPVRSTGVKTARPARASWPATGRPTGPSGITAEVLRLRAVRSTRPATTRRARRGQPGTPSRSGSRGSTRSAPRRRTTAAAGVRVCHTCAEPHQRQANATREGNPRDGFLQVHRVTPCPETLAPIYPDKPTLDSLSMIELCARWLSAAQANHLVRQAFYAFDNYATVPRRRRAKTTADATPERSSGAAARWPPGPVPQELSGA